MLPQVRGTLFGLVSTQIYKPKGFGSWEDKHAWGGPAGEGHGDLLSRQRTRHLRGALDWGWLCAGGAEGVPSEAAACAHLVQ